MELPKNIVQFGEPDKTHKIFVEDYVVSYIKQVNRSFEGQRTGIAFYGKFKEEGEVKYYFLYGASQVPGLENRGAYLSQADKEEICDIGSRYFENDRFLAWCTISSEMPECIYIQVQGKGVSVNGFACFYEKNESMLNFMLQKGPKEDAAKQEKQIEEKAALREYRSGNIAHFEKKLPTPVERSKKKTMNHRRLLKNISAATFIVICGLTLLTANDNEKLNELQVVTRHIINELTEQKLPDEAPANGETNIFSDISTTLSGNEVSVATDNPINTPTPIVTETPIILEAPVVTESPEPEVPVQVEELPVAYTIVQGDTLISICMKKYGSIEKVQTICTMNEISNPDDIKVGQTILLP